MLLWKEEPFDIFKHLDIKFSKTRKIFWAKTLCTDKVIEFSEQKLSLEKIKAIYVKYVKEWHEFFLHFKQFLPIFKTIFSLINVIFHRISKSTHYPALMQTGARKWLSKEQKEAKRDIKFWKKSVKLHEFLGLVLENFITLASSWN